MIESVNAKYDPTWPSSASLNTVLMDIALSLAAYTNHMLKNSKLPCGYMLLTFPVLGLTVHLEFQG